MEFIRSCQTLQHRFTLAYQSENEVQRVETAFTRKRVLTVSYKPEEISFKDLKELRIVY